MMIRLSHCTVSLVLLLCSCAAIHEAEVQQAVEPIVKEPVIACQLDSVQTSRLKSEIQASPPNLLANSLIYNNGKWAMGITSVEADSLGVPKALYSKYEVLVQKLNTVE